MGNDTRVTRAPAGVIISSFDSEIRWQKPNWSKAKDLFDSLESLLKFPPTDKFLNEPINKIDGDFSQDGYWKLHQNTLVGTRVTFEIPL